VGCYPQPVARCRSVCPPSFPDEGPSPPPGSELSLPSPPRTRRARDVPAQALDSGPMASLPVLRRVRIRAWPRAKTTPALRCRLFSRAVALARAGAHALGPQKKVPCTMHQIAGSLACYIVAAPCMNLRLPVDSFDRCPGMAQKSAPRWPIVPRHPGAPLVSLHCGYCGPVADCAHAQGPVRQGPSFDECSIACARQPRLLRRACRSTDSRPFEINKKQRRMHTWGAPGTLL